MIFYKENIYSLSHIVYPCGLQPVRLVADVEVVFKIKLKLPVGPHPDVRTHLMALQDPHCTLQRDVFYLIHGKDYQLSCVQIAFPMLFPPTI